MKSITNKLKKRIAQAEESLTRVNSDVYGNPRYVIHFLDFLALIGKSEDVEGIQEKYAYAVKIANLYGGRRYNTKSYGGGIVFQSYNNTELLSSIVVSEAVNAKPSKRG